MGTVVTLVGGALLLVAPFLTWIRTGGDFSLSFDGWSDAFLLSPLVPLAAIVGAVIALRSALDPPGAGRRDDIRLVVAVLVAATLVAQPLRGLENGAGSWLGALAGLVLVGGLVVRRGEGSATGGDQAPTATATPGDVGGREPAVLAIVAGGAVTVVGSFLDLFTFGFPRGDVAVTAWSSDFRPLTLLPVLLALLVAGPVALALAGVRAEPAQVGGVPWSTIRPVLATGAAVLVLCLFVSEPLIAEVPADRGPGFWLLLLGTLTLAGGTLAAGRDPTRPAHTPSP